MSFILPGAQSAPLIFYQQRVPVVCAVPGDTRAFRIPIPKGTLIAGSQLFVSYRASKLGSVGTWAMKKYLGVNGDNTDTLITPQLDIGTSAGSTSGIQECVCVDNSLAVIKSGNANASTSSLNSVGAFFYAPVGVPNLNFNNTFLTYYVSIAGVGDVILTDNFLVQLIR